MKEIFLIIFLLFSIPTIAQESGKKIKVLILQADDHHDVVVQGETFAQILNSTKLFDVSQVNILEHQEWEIIDLQFSNYGLILSSNLGQNWPESLKLNLDQYLSEGGNLVIIHQGVASHQDWPKFREMIGLGWAKSSAGQHMFWDDRDSLWIRTPLYHGVGAGHAKQHEFLVTVRSEEHPVVEGMPREWMHGMDELYHGMRGPAENIEILATAYSDKQMWGSGDHEPIAWTVNYRKGRVFVTVLGHFMKFENRWEIPGVDSYENEFKAIYCVGFQSLLARGAEWAATGKVTLEIPGNFPSDKKSSVMPPEKLN